MADQTEPALRAAVLEKLTDLQAAIRQWRRLTGKAPTFLRDGVAEQIRADAFEGVRIFPERRSMMLPVAGQGGIGAELGVQNGHFSRFILDELAPKALHLFDLSTDPIREDVRNDPRVVLHAGDSSSTLAAQKDVLFDWIYIDGNHSRTGANRDARAALERIKPGGAIIFNDYTPWSVGEAIPYGVIPVVNRLVNDGLQFVALALTPTGYFDVALRTPEG